MPNKFEASVSKTVSKLESKKETSLGEESSRRKFLKAVSWSLVQRKVTPFFSNDRSGSVIAARLFMNPPSWFANPRKDLNCVMLVGMGNWVRASTFP